MWRAHRVRRAALVLQAPSAPSPERHGIPGRGLQAQARGVTHTGGVEGQGLPEPCKSDSELGCRPIGGFKWPHILFNHLS